MKNTKKSKGKDFKSISDTELEVMEIIWANKPPVSRGIVEEELCKDKSLAPSTIITFLARLTEKGLLSVEKAGRSNLYTPLVSRQEYLQKETKSFLDRLYHGSISAFAAALSESGISKEDKEELRKLLEDEDL